MKSAQWHCRASQIDAAVRKLYAKNGYVVLSEVRNGTGYAKSVRTADMIAVSIWPSRGMFAEGFEIKVDRGDLRRELAAPEKADDIAGYCAAWWIAVPDWLITDTMLIPEAWGIISVDDKLVAKVIRRGSRLEPRAWDAPFCCSILRNFAESHTANSEINQSVEERVQKALKERSERSESRVAELEKAIEEFREATGVSLLDGRYKHPVWNMAELGRAVSMVMALHSSPFDEIARAKAALQAGMGAIDVALAAMGNPKLPDTTEVV